MYPTIPPRAPAPHRPTLIHHESLWLHVGLSHRLISTDIHLERTVRDTLRVHGRATISNPRELSPTFSPTTSSRMALGAG